MTEPTTPRLVGPRSAARIAVSDLGAAIEFYRDRLGIPILSDDPGWAVFDGGSVRIITEPVTTDTNDESDPEIAVGRFLGLSFSVDDVAAVCAELRTRSVRIVGEPERQPWGGALAHIADPDGNVLTLVEYE